jgi:hypothetical protein
MKLLRCCIEDTEYGMSVRGFDTETGNVVRSTEIVLITYNDSEIFVTADNEKAYTGQYEFVDHWYLDRTIGSLKELLKDQSRNIFNIRIFR